MLGSELSYVRSQLKALDAAARRAVATELELNVKTLNRIASKETMYGRTDTIGKLGMYFRAKEQRRKVA